MAARTFRSASGSPESGCGSDRPGAERRGDGQEAGRQLGLAGPGLLGTGSSATCTSTATGSPTDQKRVRDAAVAAYKRTSAGRGGVHRESSLARTPVPTSAARPWSLIQRARASFIRAARATSSCFSRRDITPIPDTSRYVATHGSPWDYDRRVPILFWRKGMAAEPAGTRARRRRTSCPRWRRILGSVWSRLETRRQCLRGVGGVSCTGALTI